MGVFAMIDRKVLDQLILSHQLLSKEDQVSATHGPAQLLRDLMICSGAAELALAAICLHLNCVPDKKDITPPDYFEALRITTHPSSVMHGENFVAELHKVRSESQLRFHLPDPRRWSRAKEETLEHVMGWSHQCLGINLHDLASHISANTTLAGTKYSTSDQDTLQDTPLEHSSDLTGPVGPRYNCSGSADIKLPGWGRPEKARIANLSAGGCNVKSNYAFEVGEQIEMILRVNKMSFRVAGSVVHTPLLDANGKAKARDLGIGIQFENMTAGARDRLQELIAELKSSKVFRRRHVAN